MKTLVLQFCQQDVSILQEKGYLAEDFTVLKKEDLRRLSTTALLKKLRGYQAEQVIVYCTDVQTDKNLLLYKIFLTVCQTKERLLVDVRGEVRQVERMQVILLDVPRALYTFVQSFWVVGRTYWTFWRLRYRGE